MGDPQLIRRTTWLNSDSLPVGTYRLPGAYMQFKENGGKVVKGDTFTYSGRVDKLQPRILFEIPVAQPNESIAEGSRVRLRSVVDWLAAHERNAVAKLA